MPDWRDPEDYSYVEDLTLHQQAWEFLRRNPEYQKCWKRFQALRRAGKISADPGDARNSLWAKHLAEGSTWGLYQLYDPSRTAAEMFVEFRYCADPTPPATWDGQAVRRLGQVWADPPQHVGLRFNLNIPIRPQVEAAQKILEHIQEKLVEAGVPIDQRQGKPQASKLLLYLRALDGRAAGASVREIGLVLFPESDEPRERARDALKAARRLSAQGYRDLLLMPDTWRRLEGRVNLPWRSFTGDT